MARVLSQTASLARRLGAGAQPQAGWALGRRHSHTRRRAAGMALDAEAAAAGPSAPADSPAAAAQRLEEAIDGAMARMCEPDWAPFRPGTSYYAPPRPAGAALGLLAFFHRGGLGPAGARVLSVDEARAVASASRGYPCSTYFIDGDFPDEMKNSSLEADPAQEE